MAFGFLEGDDEQQMVYVLEKVTEEEEATADFTEEAHNSAAMEQSEEKGKVVSIETKEADTEDQQPSTEDAAPTLSGTHQCSLPQTCHLCFMRGQKADRSCNFNLGRAASMSERSHPAIILMSFLSLLSLSCRGQP